MLRGKASRLPHAGALEAVVCAEGKIDRAGDVVMAGMDGPVSRFPRSKS
jgi:hypothetical protein